eukprot:5622841-Prymnesium_polylepis.1
MLLQGHGPCKGPGWPAGVRGLATHPTAPTAASAAADATLRLWDLSRHVMIAMRPLPVPSSALAFSPDGAVLAVRVCRVESNSPPPAARRAPRWARPDAKGLLRPDAKGCPTAPP